MAGVFLKNMEVSKLGLKKLEKGVAKTIQEKIQDIVLRMAF